MSCLKELQKIRPTHTYDLMLVNGPSFLIKMIINEFKQCIFNNTVQHKLPNQPQQFLRLLWAQQSHVTATAVPLYSTTETVFHHTIALQNSMV